MARVSESDQYQPPATRTGEGLKSRIQGFGNGPPPPPLPEANFLGDLVDPHTQADMERTVTDWIETAKKGFDGMIQAFDDFVGDGPPPPQNPRPQGSSPSQLQEDRPGRYTIISNRVIVSDTLALKGNVLAELGMGDKIEIVELAQCPGRLRARIAAPAGWISIKDTNTNRRWAERESEGSHSSNATLAVPVRSDAQKAQTVPDLLDVGNTAPHAGGDLLDVSGSAQIVPYSAPPENGDLLDVGTTQNVAQGNDLMDVAGGPQCIPQIATPPGNEPEVGVTQFCDDVLAVLDAGPKTASSVLDLFPAEDACKDRSVEANCDAEATENKFGEPQTFVPVPRGISLFDPMSDKNCGDGGACGGAVLCIPEGIEEEETEDGSAWTKDWSKTSMPSVSVTDPSASTQAEFVPAPRGISLFDPLSAKNEDNEVLNLLEGIQEDGET